MMELINKCKRCGEDAEPHEDLCLLHLREDEEARAESEGLAIKEKP